MSFSPQIYTDETQMGSPEGNPSVLICLPGRSVAKAGVHLWLKISGKKESIEETARTI
jgi:hypothetical protein